MTKEEHKQAIIDNLNIMVEKLDDDTEYYDALYHLDMLCKETEKESKKSAFSEKVDVTQAERCFLDQGITQVF